MSVFFILKLLRYQAHVHPDDRRTINIIAILDGQKSNKDNERKRPSVFRYHLTAIKFGTGELFYKRDE